jgi:hypothetical protein
MRFGTRYAEQRKNNPKTLSAVRWMDFKVQLDGAVWNDGGGWTRWETADDSQSRRLSEAPQDQVARQPKLEQGPR